MPPGSGDFRSSDDRSHRIEIALGEFRALLDAQSAVDDEKFCNDRSDLMPELGVQIRMLRRIRGMDSKAPESRASAGPAPVFDDDGIRKFLQDNLHKYVIQDAISRGGQGLVYRARQVHTHRDVAIKVLADGVFATRQQLERFLREIELAARLRHPNIVSIHDSGTVQNRPYCVMEYVDGEPIDGYILLEQPDLSARIRLFTKVCRAVSYAHQRGVIHRDLKPANIVVDQDGEPRLLDFGLAKDVFSTEASGAGLSVHGQVIGTLHYLSPEQVRGEPGEIDTRTDIYALGIVFYQVLTGAFPYPVLESYEKARENILECAPIPMKALADQDAHGIDLLSVDGDVEAILRKALEKDKDRRYQSADAMAEDFDRFLRGEVVAARADTRFYILRKTIRRHRIQLAVASCFVVLATIASVVSTTLYYRAVRERDRAESASTQTQSLFSLFFTDIDAYVSRLPGGLAVLDRIYEGVENNLRTLDELLKERGGAEYERARVALNLGRIAERRGHRGEAISQYKEAVELSSGSDTGDTNRIALCIESMIALGGIHDEPNSIVEEAILLASAHIDSSTVGVSFRVLLGEAYLQRAQRANESGARLDAADAVRSALESLDAAKSQIQQRIRWRRASASANRLAGDVLHQLGDCDASDEHYDAALKTLNQLIEESQTDIVARFQRFEILVGRSSVARSAGDLRTSNEHLDPAIRDAEWLNQADPSEYEWARALVIAYCHRAMNLRNSDEAAAKEAIALCDDKLAMLRDYENNDSRLPELDALVLFVKGMLEQLDKNFEQSAEYYVQALGHYSMLSTQQINNARTRDMVAFCLSRLNQTCQKLNMPDTAIASAAECLEIRSELYRRAPHSVVNQVHYYTALVEMNAHLIESGNRIELELAAINVMELESSLKRLRADEANQCHLRLINQVLRVVQRQCEKLKERDAS